MTKKFINIFISKIFWQVILLTGFYIALLGWPLAANACSGPIIEGHLCNPIPMQIPLVFGLFFMVMAFIELTPKESPK